MINKTSSFVLPLLVLLVIIYGLKKKVSIYDTFVEGAKESFELIFTMFPCVLGMILGINIFLKSGVLDIVYNFLNPLFTFLKLPFEVVPMMIMRPIAILNNLLSTFGPDSFIGRLGSVIQGSTDTTFYVLTLYFGSIGIKKIKHALWVGLFSDLMGIIASLIITSFFFG